MESNRIITYLSSVLGDDFKLTFDDIEKETDKEIIYGLICLHGDLKFYKKKSDNLLSNLKNTLFNSAAITITGSNGVIKEVNDYFINLSEYTKDELYGKKLTLIDAKEGQQFEYTMLGEEIVAGKTWRGEVKCIGKNSKIFWLSTHIFPVRNSDGDIYEYWSISTDISDSKRVDRQLIKQNKELQVFSTKVSNELKDPARQMKELAAFIEEDYGDKLGGDGKEILNLLKSKATRLYDFVNELTDYYNSEYEGYGDAMVDPKFIISDIISGAKHFSNIKVKVDNDLPSIFGNKLKIKQVFEKILNYCDNNMSDSSGEISITTKMSTQFHQFNIEANGIALEKKDVDTLFDMFTINRNSDSDHDARIGLAMAKKHVTTYGGDIGCNSKGDSGIRFWFTWPVS